MFSEPWMMLKHTVLSFLDDEALSRGAAIAFYTVTSIAPVLLIVVAIAGLAFGQDAAQNAISEELSKTTEKKLRSTRVMAMILRYRIIRCQAFLCAGKAVAGSAVV